MFGRRKKPNEEEAWRTEFESGRMADVRKAAEWLDEVKPGWEHLVDSKKLNLYDVKKCILGQVFKQEARGQEFTTSGFTYALFKFNIFDHGFPVGVFSDNYGYRSAWRALLNERVGIKNDPNWTWE